MPLQRPKLSLAGRLYLPEIMRGVGVTTRHFVRNLTLHTLHLFGLAKDKRAAVTTQYPEERKVPRGYRGAHRLTLKPDGAVRCTACFLCATACPAKCIHIEAGEHPDAQVEKFPVRYEIDTLQCIYCGMCVEACPCDAIPWTRSCTRASGAIAAKTSSSRSRPSWDARSVLEDGGRDAPHGRHAARLSRGRRGGGRGPMILLALWRRGLLRRIDREKLRQFLGLSADPLALSRRYPMWRVLGPLTLASSPSRARDVARWLEYRLNLYDGIEG